LGLTTCAVQQIVGYLGYADRDVEAAATGTLEKV
jgi:hypothetical protein